MTIRSIANAYGPKQVTTPAAAQPGKTGSEAAPTSPTATTTPRHDSVSISDAGRALSGGAASTSTTASLTPERVADLRKKVLEGAYNSTHVVDAVAKRLLSAGDV